MNLPDLSIRRPVTIVMVFLLIIVLGVVSFSRLDMALLPNMTIPVAAVITTYEGAGPYEVESMITRPLEQTLTTVSNVTGVTSTSASGTSLVVLEFDWGVDMDFALLDVREKIDMIKGFLPDGAEDPMVLKFDPSMMPMMNLALSGKAGLAKLKQIAEDEISPRLERIPGVASVGVGGGLVRQITIDIDQEKLNAYGLSLQNVVQTLQAENLNLPGGYAQTGTLELVVRTLGEFTDVKDIAGINLITTSGGTVKLSEIAKITDSFREQNNYVLLNGEPAVSLMIRKEAGANTVNVSRRVHKELEAIRAGLEEGVSLTVVQDEAEFIQASLKELRDNAVLGGALAVLILLLFLRNFGSTIIIVLSIPISIIVTFVLVYFGKLTINMMTLGGLALGVGMMVDNSIVVLENAYRLRQEGASLVDAARDGASEVGMAITASTLTTIVAFLPVVFTRGMTAQIFRELSLTVTFSLMASLFVALTLVPMLCSKFLRLRKENAALDQGGETGTKGRFYFTFREKYRQVLHWTLDHKGIVLLVTFIVFVATLCLIPLIGMEFMPAMDQGEFSINIQMPRGSMLAETSAVVDQVDAVLAGIPEIDTIMVSVGTGRGFGGQSPDQASYHVRLRADRKRPVEAVVEEVRKGVASITGATINVYALSSMFGGFGGAQRLSLRIKGDDFDTLSAIADDLVEQLKQVEGAREVSSSLEIGRPELRLAVDRAKASAWGLNAYTIASQVRTAIEGTTATKLRIEGQEYDILVRLGRDGRDGLPKIDDLYALMVSTPYGTTVPLREVTSFITMQGPVSINREDQQRVVTVTAGVAIGSDLGSVTREFQSIASSYPLPSRYSIEIGGEAQEMFEAFRDLALALLLAALFVYMTMAAQFESFVHPFTIMSTVPLAAIGTIWALFLTGHNLSVVSIIGLIMLVGIAVNNGIVLIDYINNLRRRGMKLNEAIVEAGTIRLRPILMTSLTTILALVPMSLGIGEGAELSASIGVTVIGGLITSTFLTLLVTPVIYAVFDALGARFRRRRANGEYA
ncbi:MAG: efflux RND transporter permease subunit [Firmicutes bacterium]|nr:efflux RND transporter permease subunit [Bacillota bacterium]